MIQDAGFVAVERNILVIDNDKVKWHTLTKEKLWKKVYEEKYLGGWKIIIIYFDGIKDKTTFIEKKETSGISLMAFENVRVDFFDRIIVL